MRNIPRDGTVVRVVQLGQAGYVFERPAFALATQKACPASDQVGLFFLTVEDGPDVVEVQDPHSLLGKEVGFCAPPQHVRYVRSVDAAVALALYALNGNRVFVKPNNKSD